jgi:transcriptional regulator with XRE-family HTH domain
MSALEDAIGMDASDWRARMVEVMDGTGLSMRALSLEAGCAEGYVHSILKDGKEPALGSMAKLCQRMDVSLAWLLYGFAITPKTERLVRLSERDPATWDGLLAILEDRRPA